jgi:TRAP transporter 4TM/12TM fusion protein
MAQKPDSRGERPPASGTAAEFEGRGRLLAPRVAAVIGAIAALWSLFQLWIASPLPFVFRVGIFNSFEARSIHLGAALLLCFLVYPAARRRAGGPIPVLDVLLALGASACALYLFVAYEGLAARGGVLLPHEVVVGIAGIALLLEAARRSVGLPLVIVAGVFLAYSLFGQSMPDILQHKGVSLKRLVGYQWLGDEGIFGIPLGVSTDFVFLFVLFGALLERGGAGRYFLDLSFALVGQFRGGPAKAAILASGLTGMISGSSIANVVTTGTFTIPVMRSIGIPAVKAGAIEVAASVNGQLMPPIMGAAAFIIAELLAIPYFDVVVAAFVPATIAYLALLFISHVEAVKLGLKGLPRSELAPLGATFVRGLHYLLPVALLVWLLLVERWTASASVFYACVAMMAVMVGQRLVQARLTGLTLGDAIKAALGDIVAALVNGARNMIPIAVAVAAAGIIVGTVSLTGLGGAMLLIIEAVAGNNVYLLLALTAVMCIVLGMGLPTTANYLVVATLMAPVLVELGGAAGLVLPLIAVHLFVFYFGLMADVTPPVGLAAYAASAISRADPIRTGIQAFGYNIRTAILPVVFIFNPELLLIGVTSFWHGLAVFAVALAAILAFTAVTQGWLLVKLRWYEAVLLLLASFALFRPDAVMNRVFPVYEPIDVEAFAAGDPAARAERLVRLHVVRETPYGDRFKLFALSVPEGRGLEGAETVGPALAPGGPFGLVLEPLDDGRYIVTDLAIGGAGERAGIDFGDIVTEIEAYRADRPAKEWVYPIALVVLAAAVGSQLARRRRAAGT